MKFHSLKALDYVMLGGCLCVPAGIGIYQAFRGRKHMTTSDYFLGDRKMKVVPVALSLLVTYHSSVFIIGYPAEMYVHGSMFWWTMVGFAFGLIASALMIIPIFHPLHITSAFQVRNIVP
jgi:Na+/proline symporter